MNAIQALQPIEDRLIRHFYNGSEGQHETVWNPAVDVYESNDTYRIELELPGISKDAIEVNYEDEILSVKANRQTPELAEGVRAWKTERRTGNFYRSFRLVKDIDADSIQANYNDGVLTINLKKTEKVSGKRIEVFSGSAS
jgi:HSP20 family protein